MLTRPQITFRTGSAVLTVAGKATGETLIGHADFQLADNLASKMHIGTLCVYFKSVIYNLKNVAVVNDAVILDYINGGALSDVMAELVPFSTLHEPRGDLVPGFCRDGKVTDVLGGWYFGIISQDTGLAIRGMSAFSPRHLPLRHRSTRWSAPVWPAGAPLASPCRPAPAPALPLAVQPRFALGPLAPPPRP